MILVIEDRRVLALSPSPAAGDHIEEAHRLIALPDDRATTARHRITDQGADRVDGVLLGSRDADPRGKRRRTAERRLGDSFVKIVRVNAGFVTVVVVDAD